MCAAAPAVSSTASLMTPPLSSVRYPSHCASAWGWLCARSDVLLRLAWEREQAVPHLEIHLADDVQAMIEDQIVVTVDGATEGVLEGEHRAVGGPLLGGLGRGRREDRMSGCGRRGDARWAGG